MTKLQTMYPGVANSPETFLKEALTIDGEIMYLADGSVLGEIPTLAVIGEGQQAETVLVTSTRSDGGFAINRGVEGPKKAWTKATTVARNWTNKDYETIRANIETVNANVLNRADESEFYFDTLSQSIDQLNADFNNAVEDKVDKVDGKGLSTYDYDDEAKAKVDAIPPDPKYTDTVPDLTPYAKKEETNELIESVGAAVKSIRQDIMESKLDKTDVVNDLTTGGTDKALSAEQGKILEDTKLDKTDVINDLTTGGADKALSAEQGKTLFMYADDGKKSIADAIVGKGVSATKSDDFSTLADKISKIKTGYSVGEEVSVEEIKTFHPYENESDAKFIQRKLKYVDGYAVKECGEPSALVVDSFGRPFVATSSGEVVSYSIYLREKYSTCRNRQIRAISIRPDGDLYMTYDKDSTIYLSAIGVDVKRNIDRMDVTRWVKRLDVEPINVLTAKYYYLYCGAGNKVIEIDNGFNKTWEFTLHTAQVNAVAVGKDWNVYSGGADNKVFKISEKGEKIWEFTPHTAAVNALAVDDDGYLYSGGADNKIYKISPDGKKVWENKTNNAITAIAITPEGGVMVGTTGSTLYTFEFDGTPGENVELAYADKDGKAVPDGDVVDIVVANDASIFMVTKKEKVIYKMKYGEYKTSYKIIK